MPTCYYASIVAREPTTPRLARSVDSLRLLNIEGIRAGHADRIARRLQGNRAIDRVIIWRETAPGAPADDPYARAFDARWMLVRHERFRVHDHWMWLPLYDLHRSVWIRKSQDAE